MIANGWLRWVAIEITGCPLRSGGCLGLDGVVTATQIPGGRAPCSLQISANGRQGGGYSGGSLEMQ